MPRSNSRARWLCGGLALIGLGCAPAVAPSNPGLARAAGVSGPSATAGPHGATGVPSASPGVGTVVDRSTPPGAPQPTSTPTPHGTAGPTPTPGGGSTPPPHPQAAVCGTWAMLQVSSTSALKYFTPSINQALAVPGIQGLSLRAPWTAIASSLSIYAAGLQVTRADHVNLAIRFVAGEDTPAQDLGNSTVLQGSGGRLIPLPWGAGSTASEFTSNSTFVNAYRATVDELANYARANGIHELHLPWFSGPTAEIYLGPEIQSAPGYSLQNFLDGYEQLIDVAMSVAGNGLTVELPMSGIGTGSVVRPLEQYITSRYGDPSDFIAQWNDLTGSGSGELSGTGLQTGRQMLGQGDFNWADAYHTLMTEHSKTLEIYLQSFATNLAHAAQLRQEIGAFAATC